MVEDPLETDVSGRSLVCGVYRYVVADYMPEYTVNLYSGTVCYFQLRYRRYNCRCDLALEKSESLSFQEGVFSL